LKLEHSGKEAPSSAPFHIIFMRRSFSSHSNDVPARKTIGRL
jgi:hypothetical protein